MKSQEKGPEEMSSKELELIAGIHPRVFSVKAGNTKFFTIFSEEVIKKLQNK